VAGGARVASRGQVGHRSGAPCRRRRLVPVLLALSCTACGLVPDGGTEDAGEADAREAEIAVRSLLAAFETADTALVEEIFWPRATYDDFPNQHTYQGVDEIVGYVTGMHRWADDVLMNVVRVHPTSTGAVAEWAFSGVQARPIGGRLDVGTGNEVVLNGVTIIELDGGRIVRAADYADTGAMMLQLGGRVEMPDGTVLELEDVVN